MVYYTLNKLLERLEASGMPHTRWWVRKMMRAGLLTLPKYSFNKRFALTEEMIQDCVEDLRNRGEYHYKGKDE